jgi:hypothetical protein
MSVTLQSEATGNVLQFELTGKLTHEDYQKFVPAAEKLIEQHGKVRILLIMRDFHGWEMAAMWDDLKFDVKHFSQIERLAMVGDRAWEKGMSVFCKPFTTAKIRYFDISDLDEARKWIHEEATESKPASCGCCCTAAKK